VRLMGVSYPTVAKKIAAYAIPSARRRSKRES
jgi:hypothetical protein